MQNYWKHKNKKTKKEHPPNLLHHNCNEKVQRKTTQIEHIVLSRWLNKIHNVSQNNSCTQATDETRDVFTGRWYLYHKLLSSNETITFLLSPIKCLIIYFCVHNNLCRQGWTWFLSNVGRSIMVYIYSFTYTWSGQ